MITERILRNLSYQNDKIERLKRELAMATETKAHLEASYKYHSSKTQNKPTQQ